MRPVSARRHSFAVKNHWRLCTTRLVLPRYLRSKRGGGSCFCRSLEHNSRLPWIINENVWVAHGIATSQSIRNHAGQCLFFSRRLYHRTIKPNIFALYRWPLKDVRCERVPEKPGNAVLTTNPDTHFENLPWRLVIRLLAILQNRRGTKQRKRPVLSQLQNIRGVAVVINWFGSRLQRIDAVRKSSVSNNNGFPPTVGGPNQIYATAKTHIIYREKGAFVLNRKREN